MKKMLALILSMTIFISCIFSISISGYDNSIPSYNNTNESNLYLTSNFATHYFNYLDSNMGYNAHGSCTYVAVAMLLAYYDTYWDDNIIPENYDKRANLFGEEGIVFCDDLNSPGIKGDYLKICALDLDEDTAIEQYADYIMTNEETFFHLHLLKRGREVHNFWNSNNLDFSMAIEDLEVLLSSYLYSRGYTDDDFTVQVFNTSHEPSVEDYIKSEVQYGHPVYVSMSSNDPDFSGHAFIIYDYDAATDELYGNMGWLSGDTHVKVSTSPYGDNFNYAISLKFNSEHVCSNNYFSDVDDGDRQYFCPCSLDIYEHDHTYTSYEPAGATKHKAHCQCGITKLLPHVLSSGGGRYRPCLQCGFVVDMFGNSSQLGNLPRSANGSYILPNGIVVLVDEDIEAYFAGTLVFSTEELSNS